MPDVESGTRPDAAPPGAVELQSQIGRYKVLGELGRGGMGVVYLAYDPQLDRDVALKVVRPSWDGRSAPARSRFKREAQALARLSHPNVVSIFDGGVEDDRLFFAMEWIRGCDLREWTTIPRTQAEIFDVLTAAGKALQAAHATGVVHRDFKPQNVMLSEAGDVKVLDFGLAGLIEGGDSTSLDHRADAASDESPPLDGMTACITETGIVMGTPAYLAPEQFRRAKLDGRADQFAFCVTLYEALVGHRPFSGKTLTAIQQSIAEGRIDLADASRTISRRTLAVILRGLSERAEDRYPTMGDLLDALAASRRERWPRVVAGGGVVALLSGAALFAAGPSTPDRCRDGRARAEAVWSDVRRGEVRRVLADTNAPWAMTTGDKVVALLDSYSLDWAKAHDDACDVALDDRTVNCLQGRLGSLDGLVRALTVGDDPLLQSAVMAAASLPAPQDCLDLSEIDPPPPGTADALASVQSRLSEARSLSGSGRYDEALVAASAAVAEARAVAYAPGLAEALVEQADVASELVDAVGAERDYAEAYELALGSGDHAMAARAARGLVFVVGIQQARFEDALEWGRHGEAALARHGHDPAAEAALLSNIGSVLGERGEIDSAIEHHARALELETEAFGADDVRIARTHLNFAYALSLDDRRGEAIEHSGRGVEIFEAALGPEHPTVGSAISSHAVHMAGVGRQREALALYQQALRISRATFDDSHPDVGKALRGAAAAHLALDEHEAALSVLREAVRAERSSNERDGRARALSVLGEVLSGMGRHDEAEAAMREVLGLRERVLGTQHPDVVRALSNLGTVLREQDRHDEAIRHYARALEVFERLPERPQHVQSILRRNLARAYYGAERWEEAAEAFEDARPHVVATFGSDSPEVRDVDESMQAVAERR